VELLDVKHRRHWRSWLRKNAKAYPEIWLVYCKKNSGRPRISYEDAVEEALCFGWIDGKIQRLDDTRYARRFTPRKANSPWSGSNIARVERLIAERKMTPAGLAVFGPDRRRDAASLARALPIELEKRFRQQPTAWANFQSFPPHYRRMTASWVARAKQEETRLKRLEKLIGFSARNERIQFM
jgi:uncharacterized protein YdeI (YjbR/CyaY-like superfamily)